MATKAKLEGNKRYLEKLDRIVFYVPRGQKDIIKLHAERNGESVNSYINRLISEDMEKSK